jgi:hypothetical protein
MPFVRIWVHLIWSTKSREKLILPELKPALYHELKLAAIITDGKNFEMNINL